MNVKTQMTWPEKVEALEAQVNALAAENAAKGRCLAFFASVIKSGESWGATCQAEYDAAQARQPEEKGHGNR